MNKLWLGFDLQAAIDAPILHVNDKGQVEYESNFNQVRPWSEPPVGWTPQCILLKAPAWISATECPRPSTLQLWEPSGVEKLSGGLAPVQSCVLQGRGQGVVHTSPRPSTSAPWPQLCLCSSLHKLVFRAVAAQTLPHYDLFPRVICSFYMQVYL